jgi:E3 ubiquitin-protein ligase EDD1
MINNEDNESNEPKLNVKNETNNNNGNEFNPTADQTNIGSPCKRSASFFKRSDSTLCLGGKSPDPFHHSIEESLPLAIKPHLLQPHSRLQDMFRVKSKPINQFKSLNKIGLMFSSLRYKSPYLKKSKVRKSNSKTKHAPSQFFKEEMHSKIQEKSTCLSENDILREKSLNDLDLLEKNLKRLISYDKEKESNRSVVNDANELLDRWRLSVDLFGRVFCDDVGIEPGSIIRQLGGFQLKEVKLRREMERLRNVATRELLMEVDRKRDLLLQMTFKALNNMYNLQINRRNAAAANINSSSSSSSSLLPPPLCLSRIKVTFREEQGEGSGVARSFYTAFAEAVLCDMAIPNLEYNPNATVSSNSNTLINSSSPYAPFSMQRYRNIRAVTDHSRRTPINTSNNSNSSAANKTSRARDRQELLNTNSIISNQSSMPNSSNTQIISSDTSLSSDNALAKPPSSIKNAEGSITPTFTSTLNVNIASALSNLPAVLTPLTSNSNIIIENDNEPLFWQPDSKIPGFYSPRPGKNSEARLNAFRNVGRIIAICLLQNELCPITLSRHVLKYILNRPVKWHDLAFFDSQMYESFRKMINDAEKYLIDAIKHAKFSSKTGSKTIIRNALLKAINDVNEKIFNPFDLTFNIDLPKEEGGINVDLIENGSKISVDCLNMYDFVKRYSEFRLMKNCELCLNQLKNGIYDVLPRTALDGLTAEDFRLLLNGIADINIHTLASYTTISDESKESNRRSQFEKWFWTTIDKMNQQEKQELLFFWTGSPYLPASEEGFQPLPTITLRPPSDHHLPTANTCINRLYIPLYSSKSILKSKILQAIKTKTFGFV